MTIEEKRQKVHDYCNGYQSCEDCIFNTPMLNWTKKFDGEHCLHIDLSPESDLDKALALIGYKKTPTDTPSEKENTPIKDSGERREFTSGAVRDMHEGKGDMASIPWESILIVLASKARNFVS